MNESLFLNELKNGANLTPEENVFEGLWQQYERIIVESLISAFGLDFIIKDQYGGDVDTINNVRAIENDPEMHYKNIYNQKDFINREKYDPIQYHSDPKFTKVKSNARKNFDQTGTTIHDGYVKDNILIPRNNMTISREHQGQLDHIISAKEIHDDPGRILAGLNGMNLANDPVNLSFTNACLNLNKRDMSVEEYIKWCDDNPDKVNWRGIKGEPLPETVKSKLREEYNKSKKEYDFKLARTYYTSPKFAKDTALAASRRGFEMGIRQAVGFAFAEIWFVTKDELKQITAPCDMETIIRTAGNGIKKGFLSAMAKYRSLLDKFKNGAISGFLASITTTIVNAFFTTAKNLVHCIRQIYASVVEAGKIILYNPDNLFLGDRIKSASIVLATGASILAGTLVGEVIEKTPVGMIPVVGSSIKIFTSTFVSGVLSCTFLLCLDRSKFINKLINELNKIPSEANNFKLIAEQMEYIAAELELLDINKFKLETSQYRNLAYQISNCNDENQMNAYLLSSYMRFDIKLPWNGDLDIFMNNKSEQLIFE